MYSGPGVTGASYSGFTPCLLLKSHSPGKLYCYSQGTVSSSKYSDTPEESYCPLNGYKEHNQHHMTPKY